jgi:hypothetical protein
MDPGLNCVKMDPEIVGKKYTDAHSIPDIRPRKQYYQVFMTETLISMY